MSDALTLRQQQVLEYIEEQRTRTGVVPTSREIQSHFGFASQTAAMNHLRALERKGVIHRQAGKARALSIVSELRRESIVDIPLYGQIAAGLAESSVEQEDLGVVSVDAATTGIRPNARVFALTARGDSMIGAQICSGDTVILEVREPRNGDIVAALIDGETTLKRYVLKQGIPYLKAENPEFPDLIPGEELRVQGVMVALIRKHS